MEASAKESGEREVYDPDDAWTTSPQLKPVEVHFVPSRSQSPAIWEDQNNSDFAFDDSCEGLMSDLYPQFPRVPEYTPPTEADPYRWCFEMDLPLTVSGTVIPTRPDSGCDYNVMRASVASYMGLPVSRRKEHRKSFRVANGRNVEAVGRVSIWSCFPDEPWKEMRLDFYILPRVITPVIMGMSFLTDKNILSENRHRLLPRKLKRRGPFQVSLLNSPKTRLRCVVQSETTSGYPDTGSEVDLMALSYVKMRELEMEKIEDEEADVVFADGSSATLVGKVTISLIICSEYPLEGEMTFYVLEDLTCDILFGEDFLHSNEIFQKHQTALLTIEDDGISEANAVFKKNKYEKLFSRFFRRGKERAPSEENGKDVSWSPLDDARELDFREENEKKISKMEGREREVAIGLEAERIDEYDRSRGRSLSYAYDSSHTDSMLDALEAFEIMGPEAAPPSNSVDQEVDEANTIETPRVLPLIQSETIRLRSGGGPPPIIEALGSLGSPQSPVAWRYESESDTDMEGSTPVSSSDRMSNNDSRNMQIGEFKCEYPGCSAQPFQTQYLLYAHVNLHSSDRPHFCSVKGCPRSEGGKGFKRKTEMIRHGLLHDSPGYICPFCTDWEHKYPYPRPDDLQRHVRVHHIDKDKDDLKLRDVLSQRLTGPSRGRRRRAHAPGPSGPSELGTMQERGATPDDLFSSSVA